jgi:hypothetical protein
VENEFLKYGIFSRCSSRTILRVPQKTGLFYSAFVFLLPKNMQNTVFYPTFAPSFQSQETGFLLNGKTGYFRIK